MEMLRISMTLEESLHEVKFPFLVLQGEKDTVTDPEISKTLYDRASSKDKTLKLYIGMCHGVATGESDENIAIVFADIIEWLDKRANKTNFSVYTRNSRGLKLFTCRWLPYYSLKGLIFLCHGSIFFSLLHFLSIFLSCMIIGCFMALACGERLASVGYVVFGVDYEGHGRSGGIRCLITKFDNIVDDCEEFFKSICGKVSFYNFISNNLIIKTLENILLSHSSLLDLQEYMGKSKFLYGDSMGGSMCLVLHKRDPLFWDGVILVAPICKISEKLMKPIPMVVNVLTKIEDIVPKWKIVPTKNIINNAFKDHGKRKVVKLPFLVLQGEKDTVTGPEISKALYDQASSKDKTLKLYIRMCYDVETGESDENITIVFANIIEWLDKHSNKTNFGSLKLNKNDRIER
ncbi:Caffeoylshikimate esterase, partial [Mucuna pruriens]